MYPSLKSGHFPLLQFSDPYPVSIQLMAMSFCVIEGLPGADGMPGHNGTDGIPGQNGLPGVDGKRGKKGEERERSIQTLLNIHFYKCLGQHWPFY